MQADASTGNRRGEEGPALSRRAALGAGVFALSAGSAVADEPKGAAELATTRELARTTLAAATSLVATRGFGFPGDGGGALWRRVESAPAHGGYVKDAAGAIFEIADGALRPEMFGAQGGDADDRDAIQQAVSVAAATSRRVEFTKPRYSLAGEIRIPGNVFRFSLVGASFTTLTQMLDDTSVFFLHGENTSQWLISGLRFEWRRNQTPAHRRSYAVRFESDRPGGAGHFNFEISNCLLVNGFRGFGQSDDAAQKPKCPIWGGTFRLIRMSLHHSGSAIFLRTWGRTGQPNNRIEHFYGRCDAATEPAIVVESSDTAVLTSVEFNRGKGCQLLVENASNVIVEGIRFEEVELGPADAFVVASGRQTNLRIAGLSVQSVKLASPQPAASSQAGLVRVTNDARVLLDGFTDMPWRAPSAKRDMITRENVAVLDVRHGIATAGWISPLNDPAFTVGRQSLGGQIGFRDGDRYDFEFRGAEIGFPPRLVSRRGSIVAVCLFAEGINEDTLKELQLLRNGHPILDVYAALGPKLTGRQYRVLPRALKADDLRLVLMPADVLELALPKRAAVKTGSSILFSVTAIGG